MRLREGRTGSAAGLMRGPNPDTEDRAAAVSPAGAAFPRAGRRDPAPRVAALLTLAAGVLLGGSAVLHLLKGLDFEEALAEAFLAGLLAGQGGRFFRPR